MMKAAAVLLAILSLATAFSRTLSLIEGVWS